MFLAVLTSDLIASFVRGLTLQLAIAAATRVRHTCRSLLACKYNLDLYHALRNNCTKPSKPDAACFSYAHSPFTSRSLQAIQANLFAYLRNKNEQQRPEFSQGIAADDR